MVGHGCRLEFSGFLGAFGMSCANPHKSMACIYSKRGYVSLPEFPHTEDYTKSNVLDKVDRVCVPTAYYK